MKKWFEIIILFTVDLLTITIILKLSILVRKHFLPSFIEFPEFLVESLSIYWWVFPIWISFFAYEGLLTKKFSFWDEVKQLWKAIFFSTVAVFSVVFLGKMGGKYSRTVIVSMGIISFPVFPIIRINAKRFLRSLGLLRSKVLIIGAGKRGMLVAKALKEEQNLGYKVAGFLDDDPEKSGTFIEGVKIHKGVNNAERYIGKSGINSVVIAIPGASRERLNEIINRLQHKAESIFFIPDISGIAVLGTKMQHFFREQTFALEIQNNLAKPVNIFIKRCFDFMVGGFLLLLLSIPISMIALLIRIDSPGRAIFSQYRLGRKKKPFRCHKFRTMFQDAEEQLQEILTNNEGVRREWEKKWKIKEDPRVTRMGKFLRTTSLDELPQLINVLKGEMSLIGPRPYLPHEVKKIGENMKTCFSVLPGITGLWQVSGRSNTSYDYRIALDAWYVRNWNLWLDIVILLKTIRVVLKREGAW